MSAYKREILYL